MRSAAADVDGGPGDGNLITPDDADLVAQAWHRQPSLQPGRRPSAVPVSGGNLHHMTTATSLTARIARATCPAFRVARRIAARDDGDFESIVRDLISPRVSVGQHAGAEFRAVPHVRGSRRSAICCDTRQFTEHTQKRYDYGAAARRTH